MGQSGLVIASRSSRDVLTALMSPDPQHRPGTPRGLRGVAAFSLLEVILAISIAVGILIVAMLFHQQATVLRTQLLEESERVAAVRQLLDRLSADLRATPAVGGVGFTGDGISVRFVMAGLAGSSVGPETDLRLITYSAVTNAQGSNVVVTGITRTEAPLVGFTAQVLPALLATETTETNTVAASVTEPLTESIHFLRFRFFDGASWKESWSGASAPPGVEVSLGIEPLPEDATADKYPYELFRRVIFVPSGSRGSGSGTNSSEVLLGQARRAF